MAVALAGSPTRWVVGDRDKGTVGARALLIGLLLTALFQVAQQAFPTCRTDALVVIRALCGVGIDAAALGTGIRALTSWTREELVPALAGPSRRTAAVATTNRGPLVQTFLALTSERRIQASRGHGEEVRAIIELLRDSRELGPGLGWDGKIDENKGTVGQRGKDGGDVDLHDNEGHVGWSDRSEPEVLSSFGNGKHGG